MNRSEFEKFLVEATDRISLTDFVVSVVVALSLSWILARTYRICASSFSNRSQFADNFQMICFTTMIIITVVKASLALSLGLVGALSIVRFRTAVKDPEELAYLFFCIAIGLGAGAGQWLIATYGTIVVVALLLLRWRFRRDTTSSSVLCMVNAPGCSPEQIDAVIATVSQECRSAELKRLDESTDRTEVVMALVPSNYDHLRRLRGAVRDCVPKANISWVDHDGSL